MYDQNTTVIPAQDPAGSYAPAPSPYGAPAPKRRNTAAFVGLGAIIALILLAGGLALFGPLRSVSTTEASAASNLPKSSSANGAPDISEIPTSIELPAVDEVPALPAADDVPASGPASTPSTGGSTGGSSSSGGGAPAPQPPAPAAPAPVITSFSTPENIDCHNGNFQTFTASWSTTNAVKVSISIDGPGVYKYYGPTGSDSLPFNCSTPHTFLLTAYGHDGSTVTKSITLHPRNAQTPDMGDEDSDSQDSDSQDSGNQGSDEDSDSQAPSTPDEEI